MSSPYWLTRSEIDLPGDTDWLSPAEMAVVSKLSVPKRERDWLLGRWTAKQALAAWPGLAGRWPGSAHLEIRAAGDGAPEAFLDGEPLPLSVSISHSGGRALCALSGGGAVGCDLEQIETRSELFVHDYFTPHEQELVASWSEADRPLYENLIWSAKESALKALRLGLRADSRSVEVSLLAYGAEDGWHRLEVRRPTDDTTFAGWWRQDGDFVITLVTPPPHQVPERLAP